MVHEGDAALTCNH